jgi:hypothetical protein
MKRILLAALLIPAAAAFADDDERGSGFAVTVTNITAHQVFTPIVVASHREGVRLFSLGQAADKPLEVLAEAATRRPSRPC